MNFLKCSLLFLFASQPLSQAAVRNLCAQSVSGQRQRINEWRGSGLTFKIFERWLHSLPPGDELTSMVKFAALSHLLRNLPEPLLMIPRDHRQDWEVDAPAAVEVGPTDLISQASVGRTRPYLYHWESLPVEHPSWDFEPVLDWLRSSSSSPSDEALIAGAINAGMKERSPNDRLASVRPTPVEKDPAATRGIGVRFQNVGGRLVLWKVFVGGAAERAGLQAGDEIVQVGDLPAAGNGLKTVQKNISRLAEAGLVPLQIRRQEKLLFFSIVSAPFNLSRDVHWDFKEIDGFKLGYLAIYHFGGGQVRSQVARALDRLRHAGVQGLVLDLRGNPGGELETVQDIAGYFLGKGQLLLYTEPFPTGTDVEVLATHAAERIAVPLIVLIDDQSASAAEILAGALQQSGLAYLLGISSFGKASVQTQGPFGPEAQVFEGLPVTFTQTRAHYYFPSGDSPQGFGLPVDFEVYLEHDPRPSAERLRMHQFRTASWVRPQPMSLKEDPFRTELQDWLKGRTFKSHSPDSQEVVAEQILAEWIRRRR